VISDIATPAERGGYLGLFTLGPLVSIILIVLYLMYTHWHLLSSGRALPPLLEGYYREIWDGGAYNKNLILCLKFGLTALNVRSMFWFLAIMTGVLIIFMAL
jgi:hypothetical protein